MSKADPTFSYPNAGLTALNVVTLILGVISNSTVCFVLLRSRRMLRNLSNFLVLQLSVADVILRIHFLATKVRWIFGGFKEEFLLLFCIGNSTIGMFCFGVVFSLLAGIALDRFVNIVYPIKGLIVEKKKIKATVLVWTYAIATSILTPFYVRLGTEKIAEVDINERNSSKFNETNFVVTCCIGKDVTSRILFLTAQILLFFVPLMIIMFCYIKMFIALKDKDKGKGFQHSFRTRSKRQVVKMLLIVVISYIVCWMPLLLFNILKSFNFFSEKATKERQFYLLSRGFAGLSSCVNPLIYAFYNPRFRNEFLKLFRCKVRGRRITTLNSSVR